MEKQPMQKWDSKKILLLAIAVLAVVLIAVVAIAISVHTGPSDHMGSTQTNPSTETQAPIKLSVESLLPEGATIAETAEFTGVSDPGKSLTVNGKEVQRNADGSFTCQVPLQMGANQIVFACNGETAEFQVQRRFVVEHFSPMEAQSYNSGATIQFAVSARKGSQVKVIFNGEEIALKEAANQHGSGIAEGFALFTGAYKLPELNTEDLNLGVATFTATFDDVTEELTSGELTCLKATEVLGSDPSVTPAYGDYIDVGSGYVAEVVIYSAETFGGKTNDDYSRPTNNYLPKGTMDYCSTKVVENGKLKYVVLRSGQRVYVDKKSNLSSARTQVVDRYVGQLPDHNEIGFVSMENSGRHTVLTLDCLWKAPFYFDLLPQSYAYPTGGSDRNYSVASFTATHVDITFCYTTKVTGTVQLPQGNHPFQSAEWIQNESDCILRLKLKKTGGFYGWDAYYNDAGQLCFRFLNPAVVSQADNAYGADLTGVQVMIDVGHGGVDPGTVAKDENGKEWWESDRNMALAKALRQELESIGATVIFNRETEVSLNADERIMILKNAAPDYCLAIHHNSIGGHPNINGFEVYYYNPFSQQAAKLINQNTKQSGVYRNHILDWHIYFVARQTVCPVVLTENGYFTNAEDLQNTIDPSSVEAKAKAMAQGIADYFLAIQ